MAIMLRRTLSAGFIAPCLPTKTTQLPSSGQWLHEIKCPAECRWLGGPMSRWEELKMLLLALAMSLALAAAGALLAIGLAHLW